MSFSIIEMEVFDGNNKTLLTVERVLDELELLSPPMREHWYEKHAVSPDIETADDFILAHDKPERPLALFALVERFRPDALGG